MFTPRPGRLTNEAAWKDRLPSLLLEALLEWVARQPFELTHRRWLDGMSGSYVAVVLIEPHHGTHRGAIIKLVPPELGPLETLGLATLTAHTPPEFAQRHLVATTATDRLENRWFLHVQNLAQVDVARLVTLGELIGEQAFGRYCATVVESVVTQWRPGTDPPPVRTTVADYLTTHLREHLSPDTGGLAEFARLAGLDPRRPAELITVPDRRDPLPNPLTLLSDTGFGGTDVTVFVWNGHGDLNLANVLIPTGPPVDAEKYLLVDLGRFSPTLPVSRDAVKLLLFTAERWLKDLVPGAPARPALAQLLVDPCASPGGPAVNGYASVVRPVYAAGATWFVDRHLALDHHPQYLLVLIDCALRTAGRARLSLADRWWFFEVAALAMRDLMNTGGRPAPDIRETTVDRPTPPATSRALPTRRGPVAYTGATKLSFTRRLGDSWRDLAVFLEIAPHDIARFASGDEARKIWEWLEVRGRLTDLRDAMRWIDREDLATLLDEGETRRP